MRLWHNPRCSKSRQALALLTEAGSTPEIYLYLETPPNADELDAVLGKLALPAARLVRTGQAEWKASGLTLDAPEQAIREALLRHPILIERPVLETPSGAVIGRPPEAVLALI